MLNLQLLYPIPLLKGHRTYEGRFLMRTCSTFVTRRDTCLFFISLLLKCKFNFTCFYILL